MAYTFPGFEITGNIDTDRFQVDVGTINYGECEFVLHLLRSARAPKHAIPSVASIAIGEDVVWKYNAKMHGDTFSRLARVGDEPTIAFVLKDTGSVVGVVPFSRLDSQLPLDLLTALCYKRAAAEWLKTDVALTTAEQVVVRANAAERQQVENLQAKRQAEHEARRQAREEARAKARAAINGRPTVSVRTQDGHNMFGQPVTADELPALEPLHFYVLVGSFDENGEPQNPQKAFKAIAEPGKGMVMANGGSDVVGFIEYKPKPTRPEFSGTQVFEISAGIYEVPVYANRAAIDTLVEVGVKAVEFAAYPAGNSQYVVFALKPTEDGTKLSQGQLLRPYGTEPKPVTPESGAKPSDGKTKVTRTRRETGDSAKSLGGLGQLMKQDGVPSAG